MFFLIYFILLLQIHDILCGHECTDDEVYFEESCYKLVKLKPSGSKSTRCTNIIDSDTSNECIEYLDKFIQRLIQIYKNNLKLNDMYNFGFLDFKSTSHRSIIESIIKNHEIKKMNIFMNYYFYNNNYYVENQPSDDEHPNVMMHGSNKGLKCIYGQRIHDLNESFSFYYDDCNKEFPFICVKPYHSSEYLSVNDSVTDRCSYFDKVEPGGNWFECDKLDETGMSKSHKCCMYNVKWRENFNDANKLCRKFDSFVFSLRLKGYKVILEKYAAFLSTNYLNSKLVVKDLEFFSFWTSCKSLASDPDNLDRDDQVECVQKNPVSMLASTLLQFTDVKGMKINALVNLANSTMRKNSYYNLTFVDLLLKSLKLKNITDKSLKDCNDEIFITSGNVIPNSSNLSLSECLYKLNRIFITEAFYLGRRKSILYKLETITYRTNNQSNNLNETKCFHYSKFNDGHYLSIPILNKCYHFTISDFKSNMVNMTADDLKSVDYSAHPNYDIELDNLNPELISILMTTIGIADYKPCDSNVLLTNNYSIFITKNMCFNLISLIKFVNKNDYYLNGLTRQLTDSQIYIRLHSYSHIKAILHLTCIDQVFKLSEAIFRCSKFNDEKFCLFTCPVECAESNDFGQVWQFSSRPFLYLNTSSICLAAIHSNIFQSNLTEFKLYLNRNHSNSGNFSMTKIKRNRINLNLWPPVYIKNTSMLTTIPFENGFYFERNTPDEIKDDIINNDAFIVIKAVYYINDEKSIITFMLYHDLQNEIKSTKFNFGKLLKFDKKMNISIEFLSEKAISFTFFSFNRSFLNNYYDVTFKPSLNKSYSIKFPINLVDFTNLKLPNEHTIRLSSNEKNFKSVRFLPKSKSKSRCKWHINSLTSGINCDIDLDLQMDNALNIIDIENELNVIYAKNFTQDLKAFTRIILTKNNSRSLCKNGGIPLNLNSSQCLCLPGYFGSNCEKICKQKYFGNRCQFSCLENNCKGSLICSADPIGCSCAAGFKGFQCDETCSIGTWGPNCLFECLNCKDCNIFTGDCDCAINKKGNQCDECNEGFYGKDCTEKCSDNCVKCDRINGTCLLFANNTSRDCLLDYLNDCSIETNQYLVKEFKLNTTKDFSLICVLKYFDSNDSCDDAFKETCGFISFVETKSKNQHSKNKCLNSSQYADNDPIYLAEICSELLEFKVINQKLNWIGFLSRKFDCQQCSGIKLCNISSNNLNENQLVSNEKLSDFSLRVITMWMTTFVLLLLFSFLFSLDKNNDENFLNAIENLTLPIQSYEI